MSNITPIRQPFAPDDIPAGLRKLADDIEAGKYDLRTTCVVALGHTEEHPVDGGDKAQYDSYELFGFGPRCDAFTVRGLLLTVATREL